MVRHRDRDAPPRGPTPGAPVTAVVRGDALSLPLADESVDLIVTSPPYFGQRSYKDGGEHYDEQIGAEPTPQEFLAALWAVTSECWRALKPSGSMFLNLGDKRSGSGAPGTTTGLQGGPSQLQGRSQRATDFAVARPVQGERSGISTGYVKAAFGRAKSKQLLPHRYAIGCEDGAADPDGIGWIVRQDLVWSKPNGMPESVRDRTRDAHEYWFHLVKQGDYFSSVDEIREPHKETSLARSGRNRFAEDRFAGWCRFTEHDRPGAGVRSARRVTPIGMGDRDAAARRPGVSRRRPLRGIPD